MIKVKRGCHLAASLFVNQAIKIECVNVVTLCSNCVTFFNNVRDIFVLIFFTNKIDKDEHDRIKRKLE
jgi:hypothetical protein